MANLEHWFSLVYWVQAAPGSLTSRQWALCLTLGALLALGTMAVAAARRRRAVSGPLWILVSVACMSGLAAVTLRLAGIEGATARLWAAGAALALGLALCLALLLTDGPALGHGWRALWACQPPPFAPKPASALTLVALHTIALTVVLRVLEWPLWAGPAWLAALLLPQGLAWLASLRQPRGGVPLANASNPLGALLPVYLLALAQAGGHWLLGRGIALPLLPALILLSAYALAYQAAIHWRGPRRVLVWAPALLVAGSASAWATWAYVKLYARGVSGSDPYCYVQMAVDVMRHGTLLHRFPLALLAQELGIDPEPVLHIGYRLPIYQGGWAATVWPAGHSVLLGLAGRLAGEPAIYLGTPLMALASIAATIWVVALLCDDLAPPLRWLAGSVAGLLVATSFEQLRWVLVHMADAPAQLFSTLTVALAWWGARRRQRGWVATAGLALALAYWMRHTQLLMALPALGILATEGHHGHSRRELALDAAVYLGAALLGALPDLTYHHVLHGSPLIPESKELSLYTLRAVPAMTALLVREWLAEPELGYLAPFLAIGTVALWRYNRRAALVVGLWLAGLWAIQTPYASLRLRNLLPALPALALLAGYGIVRTGGWLARRRRAGATLLALAVAGLLWARTAHTAMIPERRNFNNFGYLWSTQRDEFAALQGLLERDAVIGATLNSGPVKLYAGYETFLPAVWESHEFERFLRALWAAGRPVYLLDDGIEMAGVLAQVRSIGQATPVHTLKRIPYYWPDGGSVLQDAVLYRVGP